MDTYMTVTVFDGNMDTALEESHAEIKRLEKLWSVTDKNSEIYSLDHSGGKTVAVGNETAELIRFAVEMNEKTDGALDISLYPILAEWGFTTGDYKIPSDETITAMLQNVRCSEIGVEGQNITLPQGMSIDLGSIGKGETGDRITAILKENGVTSAMLDLGGNIQTIGSKPDGSDWKIGIQDPFGDGNIAKLSVSDKCVITSGGYERFFVGEDGETYWHILDPSTGRPAHSGIVSATVVGDKGRLCDALSTSLFVMGEERAKEFWRNNGGFDMILITEDGRLLVTEGLENNVELADGRKDIKTEVIEDKTAVG
ncbi:thiamine biosynthesis lipoprotein [Ruminococcus sp. YE71]|nr:thiamine biosynthesis lipoprotein [Ruminococcus sp. YE78]SFW44633.1 thiamine biosynthesis lipoprotein [Ruminococcus sp. YE71]